MHRHRDRHAGFLLRDREHAVLDMLASHADHVAAPLAGVEQQCVREPRLRADRMVCLESRDLVVGPTVEAFRGRRRELDARGYVFLAQTFGNAVLQQPAQRLEPIFLRTGAQRAQQRFDELARQ